MRIAVVTVKNFLVNLSSPKEFDACGTSGSLHKIAGGRQSALKWLITTLRMGQYHYPQPIKLCVAQFGRALALGARCCKTYDEQWCYWFDSNFSHLYRHSSVW